MDLLITSQTKNAIDNICISGICKDTLKFGNGSILDMIK